MLGKFAGFLLLLLAFGLQANADSIYEVIGTLTVPGNSSNPGVGETIIYSFELDYSQLIGGYIPTVVGTPVITSFGPLGTFSLEYGDSGALQGYVAFFSQSSTGYDAEIDLLGNFAPFASPTPSITGETWLYYCSNMSACSEFTADGPGNEYPNTATAAVYAVQIPEPGTFCLSVLGALALCLMKKTFTH
jgi:hypothetical protein